VPDNSNDIADCQRTSLLRQGIVVLDAQLDGNSPCVTVSAPAPVDAEAIVREQFGADVEVYVAGPLPRELRPLYCVGHMEREPGRLQVRFVLRGDEHLDDIVVAEDDEAVVVLATVCVSAAGPRGEACDGPWHVYLDRPLGDRVVIDGHCGQAVPYFNVYAEMERSGLCLTPPRTRRPSRAARSRRPDA
jgi:hypothetical protein